jgi:uroporphyrinogen decarboxylase
MAAMTHRERVMAALNHQQPDRVPIDLGGTIDSSIVVEGYARLKDHFGVQAEDTLTSRMMRVVDVDERILRALDIDTRGVFPPNQPDVLLPGDRYRDEWGVERVRPEGSFYYDEVHFPLAGDITLQDIANYPQPDPHDPVRMKGVRERLAFIRRETDCAAVLNLPSAFVHRSQYLRGFEDWFTDFAADRRLLAALFDAILEVNLAICEMILREVGSEVDILLASDDLGMQNGLMIAPQAYRELIKPRHKKYFQLMHDLSPAKLLFHSCGSLIDIMDDLVEIGVDALHPVQVAARGMDPVALKARWGDRLSFWGAVDTQRVLPRGTVEEVRAETRRRIDELGSEGGYVLGAVHNIQPDVPVANILAMYDEARTHRISHR